jgi:transcription antitermination protein NusB
VATRRDARRLAIDILYQADITDEDPARVLESWRAADRDVPAFTKELVTGVVEHGPGIDLLLEEHADGWTVARMPALDRTIMRLAVEELLHRDDVPSSVAISEAVEAASDLSAEESRPFVNGVLGRIARGGGGDQSGRDSPG